MGLEKKALARPRLGGLVLAGGRSTRFGSEKAISQLEGRPLVAWVVAALALEAEAVAISAAAGSGVEAWAWAAGHPVLYDDPGHAAGPLAGLAAGLAWAAREGFDLLATLPCDTPRMGGAQIAVLVQAVGAAPAAYAVTVDGPQPLCAVWRVDAAPSISERLAGRAHPAVRGLLTELGAVTVRFDDAAPFANLNRSSDG
jgi:molybdopterin-guanine dinucleotide biosynthesis protein A